MQLQEELAIAEAEAKIIGNEIPPTLSPNLFANFDAQGKQVSFNTDRDIINRMPLFQPNTQIHCQTPSPQFSTHETAGAKEACLNYTDHLAEAISQIAEVSRKSKLPTCETPLFDGNQRSYQRFIRTFKLVV